ncbi:IS3 family transposase [Clostridium gasigenes]|nr:IS3 family transposase [Clostridium gasigenes]
MYSLYLFPLIFLIYFFKPIKTCQTLAQLKKEINQYMIYYNKYRYQWDLKKMTPVQYRNHLISMVSIFKYYLSKHPLRLIRHLKLNNIPNMRRIFGVRQ